MDRSGDTWGFMTAGPKIAVRPSDWPDCRSGECVSLSRVRPDHFAQVLLRDV